MCELGVVKRFRDDRDRRRHHDFLPRLAGAGLAPRVLHMDEQELCLERCDSFAGWWPRALASELADMKVKVVDLIKAVHALGVCHRDLHHQNLLLRKGAPVVIDLELACEVDPAGRCFDLQGPSEAVPVAEQHIKAGVLTGVWWDAGPDERFQLVTMGRIFGPLDGDPSPPASLATAVSLPRGHGS